jgi:hypothetical protein
MCSIEEIAELFIVGRPDMTIVAFGSDVLDIFEVNDIMSSKGWHLNALQRPNRLVQHTVLFVRKLFNGFWFFFEKQKIFSSLCLYQYPHLCDTAACANY